MTPWFTADADDIDTDALEERIGGANMKVMNGEHILTDLQLDSITLASEEDKYELSDLSLQTDAVDSMIEEEMQRLERAIRGAIRAGYDGVDINRPDPMEGFGIVSIEPWNRPEPDGANGYRTERYTWDWFSDDELTRLLTDDEYMQALAGGSSD